MPLPKTELWTCSQNICPLLVPQKLPKSTPEAVTILCPDGLGCGVESEIAADREGVDQNKGNQGRGGRESPESAVGS